jgi:hypothetical protein
MSIKLVLLKSGDQIISDAKELVMGEDDKQQKIVGYLLTNPFKIISQKPLLLTEDVQTNDASVEITLSPWILLSADKSIPIKPDWVVTVVEPLESVKKMYEDRLNELAKQESKGTATKS